MFLPHFCPKDDGFPEDEGPFLSSKDQFFRLSSDQRNSMVTFVAAQKATLCGSPSARSINTSRATGMTRGWSRCGMVWMEMVFFFPFPNHLSWDCAGTWGPCWETPTIDLDFWRWFVEKSVGCAIWVFSWPGKPYQSSVFSTGGNAHPSLGHSGVNHGHSEVGCWG